MAPTAHDKGTYFISIHDEASQRIELTLLDADRAGEYAMNFLSKRSRRHLAAHAHLFGVLLEALEPRIALSTFNVATESDLRSAILTAESNSSSANTINITTSITLSDTASGALEIPSPAGSAKDLIIQGQGRVPAITVIGGAPSWNTRIFEIGGTGAASVTVVFKNLTIEGGRAHDGGALGGRRRWEAEF